MAHLARPMLVTKPSVSARLDQVRDPDVGEEVGVDVRRGPVTTLSGPSHSAVPGTGLGAKSWP